MWPGLAAFLLLASGPAAAQQYLGPSKCVQCHDHERPARKWQKEEPAALKGKAHYNTLKQLDAPKSAQWAKAIGLGDPYDLKGSCVKCHGTVFRGDANAGVSCESCHGPSSGYNDIHQEKGKYQASVAAGLRDLRNKVATIAKTCVECHVVPDRRLAAAGHPAGAGFDAGASIKKIVHWDTAYDYAQVTAAGKAASAGRAPAGVARGPGGSAPAAAAPAAPAASAPSAASVATPWDWSQPVRELPADYVPESGAATESPAPGSEKPVPSAARAGPPVPPSLAEDTPLPQSLAPAVVPGNPPEPPERPKAAEIAEARGKGARLLDRLLRAGARAPDAPAPATPAEYKGPDSELLRLQDEVLALALEALRRPE